MFNGYRTPPARKAPAASIVTVPELAEGVVLGLPVEFAAPFPVPPVVVATALVDVPTSVGVTVAEVTEEGFMLHAERPGGGLGFDVSWTATEPTQ